MTEKVENPSPEKTIESRLDAQKNIILLHEQRFEAMDKLLEKAAKEQQKPSMIPIIALALCVIAALALIFILSKRVDALEKMAEKALSMLSQ